MSDGADTAVAQPPAADTGGESQVTEQQSGAEGQESVGTGRTREKPATESPASRRDARQRARERSRSRFSGEGGAEEGEGAEGSREGLKRDPKTGKFVPREEAGSEEEGQDPEAADQEVGSEQDGEAGHEAEAAEERSADADPDAEAESDRPTGIKVPLGDHTITEMGMESVNVVDKESEQVVRALLNGTYKRRKEVEEIQAELLETKKQLVRLESSESAMKKLKSTDTYRQAVEEYNRIKERVGDQEASEFWRLKQHDFKQAVDQEFEQEWGKVEQQQVDRAAEQWVNEAWTNASRLPQEVRALPEFPKTFDAAVVAFNAEVEAGVHDDLKTGQDAHRRFAEFFVQRLMGNPNMRQAYQRAARQKKQGKQEPTGQGESGLTKEQIEQQAIERFKKEQAKKRDQNPPHPMGKVGSAGVGRETTGETDEDSDVSGASNPLTAKKRARSNARARARSRFQT